MIGRKVIGRWGAMFPHSYGEIIEDLGDEVTIQWEDGDISKANTDCIRTGTLGPVGIYFAEES